MNQIIEKRKNNLTNSPERSIIQENRDSLCRWNENLDQKMQISTFTTNNRIELAKLRKQEQIAARKQNIEDSMLKWEQFRVRKQEVVGNYIRARVMIKALNKFQRLIKVRKVITKIYCRFLAQIRAVHI